MTYNIRTFLGMKNVAKSDADRLLDSIFELVFKGFEEHFSHSMSNYSNVTQFFNELSMEQPQFNYVSEWFFEKGQGYLENIDTQLAEIPDIHAFLEHEKFCIEMDVNEGTQTDFLYAFTEFFPMINNYIIDFYKETLKKPIFHTFQKNIQLPGNSSTKLSNQPKWSVTNPKGSAENDAGLLLYI